MKANLHYLDLIFHLIFDIYIDLSLYLVIYLSNFLHFCLFPYLYILNIYVYYINYIYILYIYRYAGRRAGHSVFIRQVCREKGLSWKTMNSFRICRVVFLYSENKYVLEISQIGKPSKTVYFAIINLQRSFLNSLNHFFPAKR